MSFIKPKESEFMFGIIVGNRDAFPDHLAKEGRVDILNVMKEMNYEYAIIDEAETDFGVIRTYQEAKKCAKLFKKHRDKISGIIICLPNFGDEKGIANTLKMADLNVPVLIQASSDEVEKMSRHNRRDAFCGKISVCNILLQYGIPFSLTSLHTCPINSEEFKSDIRKFEKVCRIVNKIRNARLGQIGTRPEAFDTVRYSEKILELNGISIEPIDLSEILGKINQLDNEDSKVKEKIKFIKDYTSQTNIFQEEGVLKLAKLAVVVEDWVNENELDGFAFQCWPSLQDNLGIVPCAVMSMFSEGLIPAACEVDVSGLIGMLILQMASDTPSAILDWNNNYGDDPNKMVLFHCSNLPKSFFEDTRLTAHPIISDMKTADLSYGTIEGRIKARECTLLRIETDDNNGEITGVLAEGRYTKDPLETFGGFGVVEVPDLQGLLKVLCYRGFAHHVAATLNKVGDIVQEALINYLGWDIYIHNTD